MALTRWHVVCASPRAAIGALWESLLEWAARLQHGTRDPRVRELSSEARLHEREERTSLAVHQRELPVEIIAQSPTKDSVLEVSPPWIAYARSMVGTREITGVVDDPFIVECLRLAGLPASMLHDETAWCGAFVHRCMREVGITGPKGPAAARHWLDWGQPLAGPTEGCVAVFSRPPSPSSGHVGFVVGAGSGTYLILGGNQHNEVCVKPYPASRLLGFRWPNGVPLSARGMRS